MRLDSAPCHAFPSFTLALTASQLRLPEYRSSYMRRYHPYAGQRTHIHHNDYHPDYDFSPPVATHDLAAAILEPFSHGVQPAAPVDESNADVPGKGTKRGPVLILVKDWIHMLRNRLGNVQLTKDDNHTVNNNHHN